MSYRTQKVIEAINALSREPFRWGTSDCCAFVARVVGSFSERDAMQGFLYRTQAQAQEVLDRHGGIANVVSTLLGDPCVSSQTQDGDPVLLRLESGDVMLGVRLQGLVVYKTLTGVAFGSMDSTSVECGWRVE